MLQTTTMGLYRGNTNPTTASKALGWTEGEQQQPHTVLKSAFLKFPSACRHAQRRQLSGSGVISWEFRFRCAMGWRSGNGYGSLSLLGFYLKIFKHFQRSTRSVLSPPTIAKSSLCLCSSSRYSLNKCCKVSGAPVQEIHTAAASWEVSGKQQRAASTLPSPRPRHSPHPPLPYPR